MGYDVKYTLGAFDNIGKSIEKNSALFITMLCLLFIAATINVCMSMMSYIRLLHKDMGILKFMGFTDRRIEKIYQKGIDNIFLKIFGILLIIVSGLSMIVIPAKLCYMSFILIVVIALILFLIRNFVKFVLLRKTVTMNILMLLKQGKEFE